MNESGDAYHNLSCPFSSSSSCIRNSFKDGHLGFNSSGSKGKLVHSHLPIRSSAGKSLHHGKGFDR